MKIPRVIQYLFLVMGVCSCNNSSAQNPENWTKDQLVEPADLAASIKDGKDVPMMYSVGPGAVIPNSVDIGLVKDEKNLNEFKKQISKLPKSTNILIYCGCCPFEHCPNVRPAIAALQSMHFTNYHLLNLQHNIKTDWISKGYPVKNE